MGALAGVPQQRYSEERIEEGLQTLAAHGSSIVAAELTGIPETTLRDWRRKRAERYAEVRREVLPGFRNRVAAKVEDLVVQTLDKGSEAVEALDIASLSPDELSKAIQRLSVASGVYSDKANALRGLPVGIVEHVTAEETLRRLKSLDPTLVVDGSGEEITDAEEVP